MKIIITTPEWIDDALMLQEITNFLKEHYDLEDFRITRRVIMTEWDDLTRVRVKNEFMKSKHTRFWPFLKWSAIIVWTVMAMIILWMNLSFYLPFH